MSFYASPRTRIFVRCVPLVGVLATLPFGWSTCNGKTKTGLELIAASPREGSTLLLALGVLAVGAILREILSRHGRAAPTLLVLELARLFAAGIATYAALSLVTGDKERAAGIALVLLSLVGADAALHAVAAARATRGRGHKAIQRADPVVFLMGGAIGLVLVWAVASFCDADTVTFAGAGWGLHLVMWAITPWLAGLSIFVVAPRLVHLQPRAQRAVAGAGLIASVLWVLTIDDAGTEALLFAALTLMVGWLSLRRAQSAVLASKAVSWPSRLQP